MPYRLDESTGLIDYDKLDQTAALFRPKLIVAGEAWFEFEYSKFECNCGCKPSLFAEGLPFE